MGNKKYYVVFVGRKPGIYDSWPLCVQQVHGFPGNVYKGYELQSEAIAAYNTWKEKIIRGTKQMERGEGSRRPSMEKVSDCRQDEVKEPISPAALAVASDRIDSRRRTTVVDAFCLGCMFGSLMASSQIKDESGREGDEE